MKYLQNIVYIFQEIDQSFLYERFAELLEFVQKICVVPLKEICMKVLV